jgi:hypothetical protein
MDEFHLRRDNHFLKTILFFEKIQPPQDNGYIPWGNATILLRKCMCYLKNMDVFPQDKCDKLTLDKWLCSLGNMVVFL